MGNNLGNYAFYTKSERCRKFTCYYCKKEFKLSRGEYLYKDTKEHIFCSYNCRSKYKAEKIYKSFKNN